MSTDVGAAAEAVLDSVGLLARKVRQIRTNGDLTLAERGALSRLSRTGPATSAELAREEQISPQAMGATLSGLEGRGLIRRGRDPQDGRRVVFSFTKAGRILLAGHRNTRAEVVATVLSDGFTNAEVKQLIAAAPLLRRLAEGIAP
ncbi:MAG TPA: MarR family transcriptional regulator [Pseudonocardiaceae bacterium]|jgi:DNA-binding MarR family transcriptional regulator|nr:MarR family transcriptional regulator [Pseudonocardiaceae bacterium]